MMIHTNSPAACEAAGDILLAFMDRGPSSQRNQSLNGEKETTMRLHSKAISGHRLDLIVTDVSRANYGGNVMLEDVNERGTDWKGRAKMLFTLGCRDSYGQGARTSASGRHMPKASWQAHRDVMRAIFAFDPEAFLHTALADYDGREDFERKFEATGERNVGSMMEPARLRDLAV